VPDTARSGGLFPALIKHWRGRRGLSQLDLAIAAGVSSRHVSFVETGRSVPSAEMVLRLASALDVPLRHRNAMLRAAGHLPVYPEPAAGEALPASVRHAVDVLKRHHEPFPLVVIDRAYWVLDTNQSAARLLRALVPSAGEQSSPPMNLAQVTFDPAGGRAAIVNFDEVGRELLWRIQREVLAEPDDGPLRDLLDEVLAVGAVDDDWRRIDPTAVSSPTVELRLRVGEQTWSFTVLVTALQAPLEVVLDELRIEMWIPNDESTAEGCRALAVG
jgi:transcriptional regulator with XRE-family HTH domain